MSRPEYGTQKKNLRHVHTCMPYGYKTWSLTQILREKLAKCQQAMSEV